MIISNINELVEEIHMVSEFFEENRIYGYLTDEVVWDEDWDYGEELEVEVDDYWFRLKSDKKTKEYEYNSYSTLDELAEVVAKDFAEELAEVA